MRVKAIIREAIFLVLILYFFAEGLYKLANWDSFSFWVRHAPLVHGVGDWLRFAVAGGEILISIALIVPYWRTKGLYIVIICLVGFILWAVVWLLFTSSFMLPYEKIVKHTTWVLKMGLSLSLSWIAFIGICLASDQRKVETKRSNELRNMAANAQ